MLIKDVIMNLKSQNDMFEYNKSKQEIFKNPIKILKSINTNTEVVSIMAGDNKKKI